MTMRTFCPQSAKKLSLLGQCKADYFKRFDETFDFALPHEWLTAFGKWCGNHRPTVTFQMITSSTVWAYPKGCCDGPVTCCTEVNAAFHEWSKRYNR